MASRYQTEILAQIRKGKRLWSDAETDKDSNAFRIQVVEPLRQLKYDGIIQALSEVESPLGGTPQVVAVHIIGTVDVGRAAEAE